MWCCLYLNWQRIKGLSSSLLIAVLEKVTVVKRADVNSEWYDSLIFGDRSLWKKVWIKQFITSVKNLNIRQTISIFPNQNLQGWKKEEQGITEDCWLDRKCPALTFDGCNIFLFFYLKETLKQVSWRTNWNFILKLALKKWMCLKITNIPLPLQILPCTF